MIAGREVAPAEEVTERVDAERDLVQEEDAHRAAPQQRRETADPLINFISRTFGVWVLLSLAIPFGLGVAITGTVVGGLTALLWGGAVRIFLLHQVTFSINSLCHYFGRRDFTTGDHSRNLAWLAPFSLGESWHNNHHAFPTSAAHGMSRWEPDPSALVISALERVGLAWDVVRITPERQASKRRAPSAPRRRSWRTAGGIVRRA